MIVGIGMDLVETPRIAALLDRHGARARARVWTDAERAYCDARADAAASYAARFAAKEACYKALGGSEDGLVVGWHDMEVVRGLGGAPRLSLSGAAAQRADRLGVTDIHLTLTHARGVAGAVVVLERRVSAG